MTDRIEDEMREEGDPPWPSHFHCDVDTSDSTYTIMWDNADMTTRKWICFRADGRIVAGVAGNNRTDAISTTIDALLGWFKSNPAEELKDGDSGT